MTTSSIRCQSDVKGTRYGKRAVECLVGCRLSGDSEKLARNSRMTKCNAGNLTRVLTRHSGVVGQCHFRGESSFVNARQDHFLGEGREADSSAEMWVPSVASLWALLRGAAAGCCKFMLTAAVTPASDSEKHPWEGQVHHIQPLPIRNPVSVPSGKTLMQALGVGVTGFEHLVNGCKNYRIFTHGARQVLLKFKLKLRFANLK
ncbi:hypothetical protein QBC43DRAFT_334287 [Cladorrhinum sp. PSN259]|nr:hypothetical protein QBC43DRAFT_334287 [Cladorrhinum sp. PSN259]